MKSGKPGEDPAALSVTARALSVLDAFDTKHRHQTLAAIARRSGLPMSTTHRYVNQLVEASALVRCNDGSYEIGTKLWRLGLLASVHSELRELALPYMEDIFQLGVDTVQVAVLDGFRALVIDRIAGSRSMSVISRPGVRLPLHASGVGKVLLAFGSQQLQEAVFLSLDRITDQTITNQKVLQDQLAEIKKTGFASTREELAAGAISLAVPIRGQGQRVVAALGIVVPNKQNNLNHLVPVLKVSADALSRKLISSGLGL